MPEDDDDLGERERLLLLNDDVNDDVNDDDFFYASLPSSTSDPVTPLAAFSNEIAVDTN